MFYHSITEFVFLRNIFGKRSDLLFSLERDRNNEKSLVSFTHEQNIICSQTKLDDIAHVQTVICRQLFAGHVVGSRPMKTKKNLQRMIINNYWMRLSMIWRIKQVEENVMGHYDLLDSGDTVLLKNVWRSESAQKRERSLDR